MDTCSESDTAKQAAEELWLNILSDFNNELLHQKFVNYCATAHQLPLAGMKYKAYREEKGDSALIEKYMKKILVNAQLRYLPDRERGGSAPTKSFSSRMFTAFLLLLTGLILILLLFTFPFLKSFILMFLALFLLYLFAKKKRRT